MSQKVEYSLNGVHWEEASNGTITVVGDPKVHIRVTGTFKTYTETNVPAQASDEPKLSLDELATISEAVAVLASAAKHNSSLGRTVMAHIQQDRAERLKSILQKFSK